jgi:hypothetical protein
MRTKAIRGAVMLQVDKGDGKLGPVIGVATIDLQARAPAPPAGATPAGSAPVGPPR